MIRSTKIVATIGPASQDEIQIGKLLRAGINVARLNFSHGNHNEHEQIYTRLREISAKHGQSLSIL